MPAKGLSRQCRRNTDLLQLPGFGLPYDDWGEDPEEYAQSISAVMNWAHDVTTIRERCMLCFIDSISDKPDWTRKVHDEKIVSRWKQEAKDLDWDKCVEGGDFSDKMFAYVSCRHGKKSQTHRS
jgi:hypothetical protein